MKKLFLLVLILSYELIAKENLYKNLTLSFGGTAENEVTPSDDNYLSTSRFAKNFQNLLNSTAFNLPSDRGSIDANIYQKRVSGVAFIGTEEGVGSGAVLTNKYHILTNKHVVGNHKIVAVVFKRSDNLPVTEGDVVSGTVVKVNEETDLALIQVEPQYVPAYVKAIPLAKSNPSIGSDAHAIGHPSGQLWTYTKGYISQIRNNFTWNDVHKADVIQIQTPINPGNSGGPLLDLNGDLIGINTFKDPNNENMNFAVSINTVRKFLVQDGDKIIMKKNSEECPLKAGKTDYVQDPEWGGLQFKTFTTRCDGRIDVVVTIPDDKNRPIFTSIDSNLDGEPDIMAFDYDRDGMVDETEYDEDFDGNFDLRGYHTSGNNAQPDRFERISG